MFEDYTDYDGLGLAELVAKGEVHPSEVLEAAKRSKNIDYTIEALGMVVEDIEKYTFTE